MLGKNLIKAAAGAAGGEETDENFANTVLLLHGDGNQGATNFSNAGDPTYLAFKDNSSNNFPITVNGDAYGDNFGPYALEDGNWSNFFDSSGSAGWVYTPQSSAFSFDGDFTISAWVYLTKLLTTSDLIGTTNNRVFIGSGNSGWTLNINLSQQLRFGFMSNNSWVFDSNLGITVPLNQFVHIAVVRSGSTITGYVNGVAGSSPITSSATLTSNLYGVYIGDGAGSAGNNTDGYVSNVHIQKGVAINYASVGVPTSPESTTAYTSLLTCQSNRYKDNSANSFSVTPGGGSTNVAVKVFNPFGELPDGVNGSGYFDGTGDYITAPADTSLFFSTGPFCMEGWIYVTGGAGTWRTIFAENAGLSDRFQFAVNNSNKLSFTANNGAFFTSTSDVVLNTWHHVALVSTGSTAVSGTISLFLNGVREGTTTYVSSIPASTASTFHIGAFPTPGEYMYGYISNARVVKGSSVYDPTQTTITVPTAPLTNITNTQLLTCQYAGTVRNVGFIDSGPYDFPITRVGNTTQGTFSPFSKPDGSWGNYFSGSGDYLSVTDNGDLDLGTGNFCVEFFWYPQSTGSQQYPLIGTSTGDWYVIWESGNISFGRRAQGNDVSTTGFTLAQNTWQHFCVTRQGTGTNETRIFVNGVLRGVGTSTQNYTITTTLTIGAAAQPLTGYLSNVRVIKGSVPSEYQTASTTTGASIFTPPTSALTAVSGTELLTCQSNRFIDNSVNAFTTAPTGNIKVTPFSPFPLTTAYDPSVNGGAAYFDGSDSLTLSYSTSAFDWWTDDFTIECWVRVTGAGWQSGGISGVVGNYATISGTNYWSFGINGSIQPTFYYYNGSGVSVTYTGVNGEYDEWMHIAMCKTSSGIQLFGNGKGGTVTAISGTPQSGTGTPLTIGSAAVGYIAGMRIVKGTALYSGSTYTIPTAPPTAIANTSLLCNFTNAGILDNTGFNALETVGNAQIDTTTKQFGTGAMKFDGTGDYLEKPIDPLYAFGTGDFTIECWYWKSANGVNGYDGIISTATDGNGSNGYYVEFSATRGLFFRIGSTNYTNTTTTWINDSTWHHFVLSRSGTSLRYFIDGDLKSTFTSSDSLNAGGAVRIGAIPNASNVPTYFFNGFIDDLRITKGVARYTSNFTVPDKAFPNIGV